MAKVTFDYSKAAPFINEDELNLMEAQVDGTLAKQGMV